MEEELKTNDSASDESLETEAKNVNEFDNDPESDNYSPKPKRLVSTDSVTSDDDSYDNDETDDSDATDSDNETDSVDVDVNDNAEKRNDGENIGKIKTDNTVDPENVKDFFQPVRDDNAGKKKKRKKRRKKMISDPTVKPVKFGKLLLTQFLMMLPIFGIIYSFIIIKKRSANKNLRELGKVCLVWHALGIVFLIFFSLTSGLGYMIDWFLNLFGFPNGVLW